MNLDQQVLTKLKTLIPPDFHKDWVTLGYIKHLKTNDQGMVSFTVSSPHEFSKEVIENLKNELKKDKNIKTIIINTEITNEQNGLLNIKSILAVSSCKGGVGKSTLAVNFAYALAAQGHKVGLFDADIYGPSLPIMVKPEQDYLEMEDNLLLPLEVDGVKLMSFGYAQMTSDTKGPAILRGPMVSQIITQLLKGTQWGELDYLVLDMPPGTGDIQLTLGQLLPITAALIVTTPQHISFIDVVKGIDMFHSLQIPTIGVVENMSYFMCDGCQKKHYPFGQGALRSLTKEYGFQNVYELPMQKELSEASDSGRPYLLQYPDQQASKILYRMAQDLNREVQLLPDILGKKPQVGFDPDRGIVIQMDTGEFEISALELRKACQCAHCINELTGESQIKPGQINVNVYPVSMQEVGNYAVGIDWSDRHTSLFPYQFLKKHATQKA